MSWYLAHIKKAVSLLEAYDGEEPLSQYLKKYFAANKQHGSKDRKEISSLCYSYFRVPKLAENSLEESIHLASFIQGNYPTAFESALPQNWQAMSTLNTAEKMKTLGISADQLFSFVPQFSEGINSDSYSNWLSQQPLLFLRMRPRANRQRVFDLLEQHQIAVEKINEQCIALPNGTSIDRLLKIGEDVVVQDLHSQQTLSTLLSQPIPVNANIWDCCAASGGKSLLLYDTWSKPFLLTVSDIRVTILRNLRERFNQAGISNYRSMQLDVSENVNEHQYNVVICDAPCSGSGTWARTPEQLRFFNAEKLQHYVALQKKIIANAIKSVKPEGYFLYITCSVFEAENEKQVDFIEKQGYYTLIKSEVLNGFKAKADCMFYALFQFRP